MTCVLCAHVLNFLLRVLKGSMEKNAMKKLSLAFRFSIYSKIGLRAVGSVYMNCFSFLFFLFQLLTKLELLPKNRGPRIRPWGNLRAAAFVYEFVLLCSKKTIHTFKNVLCFHQCFKGTKERN